MQPAVFLDRDNTLIANDGDLGDPAAVVLLPGVADGLAALREDDFLLVVVSNQGGVARGRFTEEDVRAVHRRIAELVDRAVGEEGVLAGFYFCPFHPEGTLPRYAREHPWRKPSPGMLVQAASDLGLDLRRSWMLGDAPRDMEAGRAAGCRTVLLRREGLAGGDAAAAAVPDADFVVEDLPAAARIIRAGRHARPQPAEGSPPRSRSGEQPSPHPAP